MKKEIRNVVIYTRVSTEDQVDNYSLDNQEIDLRAFCNRNNYNIAYHYTDKGLSGTSMDKRKGLNDMLSEISKKESKIDAIIIWKLSRISRNVTDLASIMDTLSKLEVALISYSDNINTFDVMGRYFILMAGMFAEMERDNIVTQLKGGMNQRAREGKWNGGTPPIGYDYNKETQMLTVNEREANVVRKIFELYVNKDYGYIRIAKYLNERINIYSNKQGNNWFIFTVRFVLDNPIYIGKIRWGYHKDWSRKRRSGKTDNYILVDGMHEPIISDEIWEKAEEKMKNSTKPEKKVHLSYLLSGLAKCPLCGSTMVSHRIKKNKESNEYYRYYSCSRYQNSRTCKTNLIRAEEIENQVVNIISNFFAQEDIIEVLVENITLSSNDLDDLRGELGIIDDSLNKSEKALMKYYEYLVDQEKLKQLSEEKLLEMISIEQRKIDSLKYQKQEILNELDIQNSLEISAEQMGLILKNFKILFDKGTTDERIELLHALIKEIRINDSEDINERNVTEIVLNIRGLSLYLSDNKYYEVEYDTVNRTISRGKVAFRMKIFIDFLEELRSIRVIIHYIKSEKAIRYLFDNFSD